MSIPRSILFGVVLPLAACDSQVDSDHQGVALATLQGAVSNLRTQPAAEADVVVVWRNWNGPSMHRGAIVPVEGNFPAEFKLSIYEPTPSDLLNAFDELGPQLKSYYGCAPEIDVDAACETQFGVAYVMAGLPGQTEFSWPTGQALGMDLDHLLVYVPDDIPAGSLVAKLLHSTPAAGFHLYGVKRLNDEEHAERARCYDTLTDHGTHEPLLQEMYDHCGGRLEVDDVVPLPADLATPLKVTLVDDLSTADQPVW